MSVREILKISQEPVSLRNSDRRGRGQPFRDFIQDDNVPVPAEHGADALKEQLYEVLDTLTERAKVLCLRLVNE